MTEYEIATLAFQDATIAFQNATLASRTLGHWITIAQIAATFVIGLGQIGIVWYGIRAMNRASAARDRATAARDARDAQAAAEARQRDAQAQRDAAQRDADSRRRHAEAMTAFDLQRQALETLIARTAPATD